MSGLFSSFLAPHSGPSRCLPSAQFPGLLYPLTYQQHSKNLCGFHALFNALYYLKQKRDGVVRVLSGWKFWRLHGKLVRCLAAGGVSEAEVKQLKALGPLERDQLQVVLRDFPLEKYAPGTTCWKAVFFGFELLQHSPEELEDLEATLTSFYQQSEAGAVVCFLGVTSHWSVYLLIRERAGGEIQEVYLDSMNDEEVLAEGDFERVKERKNRQRAETGKKPMSARKEKVLRQHIKDVQKIIEILRGVGRQKVPFKVYQLDQEIAYLRATFEEYVAQPLGTDWTLSSLSPHSRPAVQQRLLVWLTDGLRPESMLQEIIAPAQTLLLRQRTAAFLSTWISSISPYFLPPISLQTADELKVVQVFARVVSGLQAVLSHPVVLD